MGRRRRAGGCRRMPRSGHRALDRRHPQAVHPCGRTCVHRHGTPRLEGRLVVGIRRHGCDVGRGDRLVRHRLERPSRRRSPRSATGCARAPAGAASPRAQCASRRTGHLRSAASSGSSSAQTSGTPLPSASPSEPDFGAKACSGRSATAVATSGAWTSSSSRSSRPRRHRRERVGEGRPAPNE